MVSINLVRRASMIAGAAALLMAVAEPALAQTPAQTPQRKPDLADAVAGAYAGDVISDSKGSSRSGVTLTVTRTGPNTVQITSDYPRLPAIAVPLQAVMNTIQASNGNSVFLYDRGKKQLDVTFDMEVSWSGFRR